MAKNDLTSFSLYQRGKVWYVRLWDETAKKYTPAKSTGETDRDKAIQRAKEMEQAGKLKKTEEDP
nr:hypothetical protein [Spirochaetota bacterium]